MKNEEGSEALLSSLLSIEDWIEDNTEWDYYLTQRDLWCKLGHCLSMNTMCVCVCVCVRVHSRMCVHLSARGSRWVYFS